MCDPVSITVAAVSAGSALFQGQAAKNAADAQAEQLRRQADAQRDQGLAASEQVQRDAARTRSAARAALAGSGVDVGDGSAIVIDRDITQRGNFDAANAILSGGRAARNSETQAIMATGAGKNAQTASFLQAGASAAQGWRMSRAAAKPSSIYNPANYNLGSGEGW
jgi:hypothetical protein